MSFSLYDATVPVFLQILEATSRLLDKAADWTKERQISDREIIEARLAPDMLPFSYQVKSVAAHSIGAIEGAQQGHYSPDTTEPPQSFPALKDRIVHAIDALSILTPDEVNDLAGREMLFLFKERRLEFDGGVAAFLTRFSIPNFMFHATTAYDLLRMHGLDIGKRDYLGVWPIKR